MFSSAASKGYVQSFPIFLISIGLSLTLNSNPIFFIFLCFYNHVFQRRFGEHACSCSSLGIFCGAPITRVDRLDCLVFFRHTTYELQYLSYSTKPQTPNKDILILVLLHLFLFLQPKCILSARTWAQC
jgi:hypothetical protein